MASFKSHIEAWYKYTKADVNKIEEIHKVRAGRDAEDLLENIVGEHYQFKGSHSFSGKRVWNEQVGHKNEIDLIVITKKKIYVLECKNWFGHLIERNGNWVQIIKQKQGKFKEIVHDNVVKKNRMKMNVLVDAMKSKGISISMSDIQQRIILMNPCLTIGSESIYGNTNVITPDMLNHYLEKQNNRMKPSEIFFSSIITILMDSESSSKIVDGFFGRVGGKDHAGLISEINRLPTWDKIMLHGERIVSGDIIMRESTLFKHRIPHNILDNFKSVKVKIVRSKGWFFVKSIMMIGRPIGLDWFDKKRDLIIKTEANIDDVVRLLPAGAGHELKDFKHQTWAKVIPNPIAGRPPLVEISLYYIDEIILGRCK